MGIILCITLLKQNIKSVGMHNNSIKTIINKLNDGDKEDIFLQKLSENVEYGIVWHKVKLGYNSSGRLYRDKREQFYFIQNESSLYVGALLVMEDLDDLHAYVLKKYRKQGHLFKAMSNTILPHIFKIKEKVRITINEIDLGEKKYENSKRSALSLGFKSNDGFEFHLFKSDIQFSDDVKIEMNRMTRERVKELQQKMVDLANEVAKIDDEFKMTLGSIPKLEEAKQVLKEYSGIKLENEYDKLLKKSNRIL
ncbi:hypothetical protein [Draconibacterium sediminis]|uniref:hypothetical protein n=1 Tax=Draconibacterium sediminis TaxID=1544798 RepID=UPI0026E9EBF0|nr:hypothetical protein [Draconibacterium sediminis]